MNRLLPTIAAFASFALTAFAQSPGQPNEGSRITHDSTNNIFTLSWWGRSGQSYFIQHSDDLQIWSYYPQIWVGQEAVASMGFETNAPNYFLRLEIEADPFTTDSDADGIPDGWEVLNGLNPKEASDAFEIAPCGMSYLACYEAGKSPTDQDWDGDGWTNIKEIEQGFDPQSSDSQPPMWVTVDRQLQFSFYAEAPESGGPVGYTATWKLWDENYEQVTSIYSNPGWLALSGLLATAAEFPDQPPTEFGSAYTRLQPSSGNATADTFPEGPPSNGQAFHAWVPQTRVWLAAHAASTTPLIRKMARITRRIIDGAAATYTVEAVTFTIPAGAVLSNAVDLLPSFTTNPAGGTHTEEVLVGLIPFSVTITINTFIPQEWIANPWNTVSLRNSIAEGDNRERGTPPRAKWDENGSHRTQHKFNIVPWQALDADGLEDGAYASDPNSQDAGAQAIHIGTSRLYDKATSLANGINISAAARADTSLGDDDKKIAEATGDTTQLEIKKDLTVRANAREIRIKCICKARDPAIAGSPSLDYELWITIDRTSPWSPTYAITGGHDRFPAFEVYINHRLVHKYDPSITGTGPVLGLNQTEPVSETGSLY